jgi:dihydrofolate synthase/folylpolyglutamate synthase
VTYQQALVYISSLEKRGWRLGLDRMEELLARSGEPHRRGPHFFHVAGTNGKGSVVSLLQSILTRSGYRTGSFLSPYVYDFRERIQVDGELISEEDLARLTTSLAPLSESIAKSTLGGPTEFEFKTAVGFTYWKEQDCDFVALEVGLGGRLDATNVVEPLVSVITEIGLDHQQYLGDTIEAIAQEKAGIIKPCKPVVCGTSDPRATRVLRDVAQRCESVIWCVGDEVRVDIDGITTPAREHVVDLGNISFHQRRNAATAVAAIDIVGLPISDDVIEQAVTSLALPGRMEVVHDQPTVILDGAHNDQAASAVSRAIRERCCNSKVILVYSAGSGHDPSSTVVAFDADSVHAAPMQHPRGLRVDALKAALPESAKLHTSVRDAVMNSIYEATECDVILISGSFYVLGEAKAALRQVLGESARR